MRLAGFVDDVVKFLGFLDDCSWEEALLATQSSTYQSWQKLLSATGGSLSLDKSNYTMVYWVADRRINDYRMITKAETEGEVTLQADNNSVIIKRNDPLIACKDLGIFLAPDGNMKAQFSSCLATARKLRSIVSAAALTRSEAEVFHHTSYMGWARYFLPITTFNKKQCHLI